jgi:hypothetical protein
MYEDNQDPKTEGRNSSCLIVVGNIDDLADAAAQWD